MMLFGWTMEQWAIVFAAYPPLSLASEDILDSKKRWDRARPYKPGSERLLIADRGGDIKHNPAMDWDSAVSLFTDNRWYTTPDFPIKMLKDQSKSIVSTLLGLH